MTDIIDKSMFEKYDFSEEEFFKCSTYIAESKDPIGFLEAVANDDTIRIRSKLLIVWMYASEFGAYSERTKG